jgi:DNA-binding transcriptional ArsR family regulator
MAALSVAAECLKALAHPVRLRMAQLLLAGRYTVGELAEDCDVPDNVASENLRLMQRCGFLSSERDGRRVYYRVAEPHLAQLMACIEGRFLAGRREKH